LEDRDIAVARGARIYAEIIGAGFTSGPPGDGFAPTDVDIARHAITDAFRDANRSPNEIDIVFTAGIGTPAGDKRETDILERAFGSRIIDTYVSAVSPVTGYTVGAAGALSAIAAAFTLTEQIMPPHATYTDPDPDCALDITVEPQRDHLDGALVSGYGSMGQNAAIILATHQSEPGDAIPTV
jgi:3-oxoacyl-(acyl-carrier-protein) synthase